MKKIFIILVVFILFGCQKDIKNENITTKTNSGELKKVSEKTNSGNLENIKNQNIDDLSKQNSYVNEIISNEPDIVNFVGEFSCYINDVYEENGKTFVLVDYFQTFSNEKDCKDFGLEIDDGSETCELNDSTKAYKLELSNDTKITFGGKQISNQEFIKTYKNNSLNKEIPFYINTNSYFKILSLESKNL